MPDPLQIISLGAGVQSTTMLLMSLAGVLPRADAAIFADTGCEPSAVYRHLAWLQWFCQAEGFPLYVVKTGNLAEDVLETLGEDIPSWTVGNPPFYVQNQYAGTDDTGGRLWRKCTAEYKLDPMRQKTRELVGPKGQAMSWIGISLDEKQRMRPSGLRWLTNRWPLIEHCLTRHDCLLWLAAMGYPTPPKSSCVVCPFHTRAYWRALKTTAPEDWQYAVEFDATLRTGKLPGVTGDAFVHRSMQPLALVDMSDPATRDGQMALPLWGGSTGECEGVCFT